MHFEIVRTPIEHISHFRARHILAVEQFEFE